MLPRESPCQQIPEGDLKRVDVWIDRYCKTKNINVKDRIENEGTQDFIPRFGRWRNAMDDRLENLVDPDAHFGAAVDRFLRRNGENFLELPMDRGQVGIGEIDFVNHRDDRQALFVCEMDVGDGLRLDALGRVDNKERSFAGCQAARDLVGKVHVTGRIEQVKTVFLTVLGGVTHRDRVRLDRDPALAFEIHRVEQLILFLAGMNRTGAFEQTIRQGRLAVIDVRDDAEVTSQLDRHEGEKYAGAPGGGQLNRCAEKRDAQ